MGLTKAPRGEAQFPTTLQDRNKALESLSRVQGRGEGRFWWSSGAWNASARRPFAWGKKQPNWPQASRGAISVAWATDSSHAYDRIDLDILWNTVRDRLPSLKADAEQALMVLKAKGDSGDGRK